MMFILCIRFIKKIFIFKYSRDIKCRMFHFDETENNNNNETVNVERKESLIMRDLS